jgi:hypothetical protein
MLVLRLIKPLEFLYDIECSPGNLIPVLSQLTAYLDCR